MKRYMVFESCDDYEQALVLLRGGDLPQGGILSWAEKRKNDPRATFATRKDARDAVTRTEHYRLAFGRTDLPEKALCYIAPIDG